MTTDADDWDLPVASGDADASHHAPADWDAVPTAPTADGAPEADGLWPVSEPGPAAQESDDLVRLAPVPNAAELRTALLGLGERLPLRLEASAVTRLGLPVIQVILSACRSAEASGQRLAVIDPSFAFSLAFEAFGFGPDNEPYTVEYA